MRDEITAANRHELIRATVKYALTALVSATLGALGGWRAHKTARAAQTVTEEDTNGDGRTDRWTERDELTGTLLKISDDLNHDGRADRVEIYVDGRRNRMDRDANGDGYFDTTDQFGANGRVLITLTDNDWNTVPERWVQFGAGAMVTSEWIDANQDSAPDRFRSFDRAGRVTEEGNDSDGDGIYEVNRIFNTRWPEGSPPVRIERDDNRDGIYERRETYSRSGALLAVNNDTDGDGVRDHLSLFGPGQRVLKDGYDRDGNGFFEEWRYPVEGGVRVAFDDNDDYDIDRWEPPGAPVGWCSARCPPINQAVVNNPR